MMSGKKDKKEENTLKESSKAKTAKTKEQKKTCFITCAYIL